MKVLGIETSCDETAAACLAVGPGWGVGFDRQQLLMWLLAQDEAPIVLDGRIYAIDDGGNFFDAFPFPDSGPIFNCVSCAEQNCKNQVNACYNDPACASGVVCAATSCGGFNLQCVLSCFQGKFQAAIKAFQVFTCLAQNCGQSCIGVVTGGGGLPPPGGGGPAPGGGSQTELPPVAGGFSGYVTPEMAASTGLPAGPVYVPSIEVFDAVGR